LGAEVPPVLSIAVVAAYEVPAKLALVVETLAHGILKDAGQHHSKEYFTASLQECQDAVVQSISRCGAAEELIKTKEYLRVNGEKKAKKAQTETLRRSERNVAMYTAFLVETLDLRKEMSELADKIDYVHKAQREQGLFKAIFSSEARILKDLLEGYFKEMKLLVQTLGRRRLAFSIQNKTSLVKLYIPAVSIDSYDERRIRNNRTNYGLNRLSFF
jgi:hypothetical protein